MKRPASLTIAWRMLAHRPGRATASLAGLTLAVVVMFAELGFFNGINDSAARLAGTFDCDLVVSHPAKTSLKSGEMFPLAWLTQLRDVPGVATVAPFYTAGASWWNPRDGSRNRLLLLGVTLDDPMLAVPAIAAHRAELQLPDRILFDARSRAELGRIAPGDAARLEGTMVRVAGLFSLGANFTHEGHAITGAANFSALTGQPVERVDLGLLRLAPGADLAAVRAAVLAQSGGRLLVFTPRELHRREVIDIVARSPTGIVFGLGLAVGLLIGTVVCYQILFTEVHEHLRPFAMLKAVGQPAALLARIVFAEAAVLGLASCALGTALAAALYDYLAARTALPMHLNAARVALVCGLAALMCLIAGWRAVARARRADPASLFY
jgi:putative ABC transport system permease protein